MKETKNYLVKVKLRVTLESGKEKDVLEQYLIEAVSVTDAEVKAIKEFEGDFTFEEVHSVTESKIIKFLS